MCAYASAQNSVRRSHHQEREIEQETEWSDKPPARAQETSLVSPGDLKAAEAAVAKVRVERMLALFEHPEAMDQLRQNPTLIKSAVEELLRYTSPVFMLTERYAREDVTIHGVRRDDTRRYRLSQS